MMKKNKGENDRASKFICNMQTVTTIPPIQRRLEREEKVSLYQQTNVIFYVLSK